MGGGIGAAYATAWHHFFPHFVSVVVIEGDGGAKPIDIARATDILRLRRWVFEEEGHRSGQPAGARLAGVTPTAGCDPI